MVQKQAKRANKLIVQGMMEIINLFLHMKDLCAQLQSVGREVLLCKFLIRKSIHLGVRDCLGGMVVLKLLNNKDPQHCMKTPCPLIGRGQPTLEKVKYLRRETALIEIMARTVMDAVKLRMQEWRLKMLIKIIGVILLILVLRKMASTKLRSRIRESIKNMIGKK